MRSWIPRACGFAIPNIAFPYTQFFFHRDQERAYEKMEDIIQQLIEHEHEQRNKKKGD